MDIGATLLGQMITFAIFVWFTMKFVWPLLEQAMDERQRKISDGLAAAEKGHYTLEAAQERAKREVRETREKCSQMIDQANHQANQILEKAREEAHYERKQIVESGQLHVEQALNQAKMELQDQLSDLVITGAQKIIGRSIQPQDHEDILQKLSKELAS